MRNDPAPGLGTLLRHLTELLDGDLERIYAAMQVDYRARYTHVYRALLAGDRPTIRDIAQQTGMTHSAVSQTVSHMARHGLVALEHGRDRRQRLVTLTDKGASLREPLKRQWKLTALAAQQLDRQLSAPLSKILMEAIDAVERLPFSQRIEDMRDASERARP